MAVVARASSHSGSFRVYIDQRFLDDSEAIRAFGELVERGVALAPMSLVHWLETAKDGDGSRRAAKAERLQTLSRGWLLRTEMSACAVEARAWTRGQSHHWVRDQIMTRRLFTAVEAPSESLAWRLIRVGVPLPTSAVLPFLRHVPDGTELRDKVNGILSGGADEANAMRDGLPSWSSVVAGLGLGPDFLTMSDEQLRVIFRAFETRRLLSTAIWGKTKRGLVRNDLADLAFLAVALPYCDAVCVDGTMRARIEDARGGVPFSWAPAFRSLEDMLQWLRQGAAP